MEIARRVGPVVENNIQGHELVGTASEGLCVMWCEKSMGLQLHSPDLYLYLASSSC